MASERWDANTVHLHLWVSFNGNTPRLETGTYVGICSSAVIKLGKSLTWLAGVPVSPEIAKQRSIFLGDGGNETFVDRHAYGLEFLRAVDPDSLEVVTSCGVTQHLMSFLPRIHRNNLIFGRMSDALGETSKSTEILFQFRWATWDDRIRKLCSGK